MKKNKILVIGVGNILMQDEGIGVHIINILKKEDIPDHIDIIDGGTAGFDLIDIMEGYEKIFIIDAISAGLTPGEIISFTPDEVTNKNKKTCHSLHGHSVLDILKIAKMIGKEFNVTIIGIEPVSIEYKIGVSDDMKRNLDRLKNIIKDVIIF